MQLYYKTIFYIIVYTYIYKYVYIKINQCIYLLMAIGHPPVMLDNRAFSRTLPHMVAQKFNGHATGTD